MDSSSTLPPLVAFDVAAPKPLAVPMVRHGMALGRVAASSSHGRFVAPRKPGEKVDARKIHPFIWLPVMLGAWGLLIGGRMQILRLFPSVAPLYGAIGLKVNWRQMDLGGVVSKLVEEDGRKILVVEGEIHNLAATPNTTPRVKLAVLDDQGREIYAWTAAPPKSRLNAGEKAFFRARLAAPPAEGRDVRVRFAPETPGAAS